MDGAGDTSARSLAAVAGGHSVRRRRIRDLSQETPESHFPGDKKSIVRAETRRPQGTGSRGARRILAARWIDTPACQKTQRGSYAVSRVNVAVAVDDDAQGRIYEVAAACRALGLDHTATLTVVGVFTGSMESRDLRKLWAIPGVLAVEVECESQRDITGRVLSFGRAG